MLLHPFLKRLPNCRSLSTALDTNSSKELPDDWVIIVTDIVNSTQAIEQGKYKEVNTVGVCSIVAVLNSLNKEVIPYVFGGDGASFCIPESYQNIVLEALRGCQQFSDQGFKLNLRVGVIPYKTVKEHSPIFVSKFMRSQYLVQSIFTGGGLSIADKLIKGSSNYLITPTQPRHNVDFSGFQCRWNEIKSKKDYTISLLVQPNDSKANLNQNSGNLLQSLLIKIDDIIGNEEQHHPVSKKRLILTFNPLKLLAEAKSRVFNQDKSILSVISTLMIEAIIGKALMLFSLRTGNAQWGEYKTDFIKNSDYKKIDDVLRMTFSINLEGLLQLEKILQHEYENKRLCYGIHKTDSALVTCMIEKTGEKHMHFVDANNGGYALAAKMLKKQLKNSATS